MQIGLAVRSACRQAHHRHCGIAAIYDDPDIGHTLITDLGKCRVELDAVLDQRFVPIAAEAVLATNNVRDMVQYFARGDQHAVTEPKKLALVCAAPDHHQNAIATAALRRLDNEAVSIFDDLRKPPHLTLMRNNAVKIGNGHTRFKSQLLGERLVIDEWKQAAWIQSHDEIRIALVQSKHAGLA